MSRKQKKLAFTLIKVLISAGLLIWLIARLDLKTTLAQIVGLPVSVSLLAVGMMIVAQIISAFRFWLILRAQSLSISYFYCVRVTFMGLFAGNFLPSSIGGDIGKVALLINKGYSSTITISVALLDRSIGLMGFLILLPILLLFASREFFTGIEVENGQSILLLFVGGLVVLVILVGLIFWGLKSSRYRAFSLAILDIGKKIWFVIWEKPLIALLALFTSFGSIFAGVLSQWLIAWGIGAPIGLLDLSVIIIVVTLLSMVPISLNGLGVQEGSYAFLLTRAGLSAGAVAILVITARLLIVSVSLLGLPDVLAFRTSNSNAAKLEDMI